MIRRNTWILLVLLVVVVGFSFYLTNQKTKQASLATPTLGASTLFNSTDGTPSDITIVDTTGNSVEITHDTTGTWVLKAPTSTAADQAAAEAAATQVSALRVLSEVQLGPDIVGLDKPSYTIILVFTGGKTHKLTVGSVTPIEDGYYAQLDAGNTQIVDKPGLDALLGMLTNPPYLATLTPEASPTSLASDTPTVMPETPTPEITLTPSTTPVTATSTP